MPDKFALYESIRRDGGRVLTVSESNDQDKFSYSYWSGKLSSVPEHSRVMFARNMGSMLASGLSLGRALDVSQRQAGNAKLEQVLSQVAEDVRHGSPLNEAMAKYPSVFSKLFVAMVRAGEESGNLSGSLAVVGEQMERAYALKKSITGALIYPCVIVVAICGVGVMMMTSVVPQLAATFKELHSTLPMSTQLMIGFSDFLVNRSVLAFSIVAVIVGTFVFGIRTKVGKRMADYAVLHIPIIHVMVKETNAARAARTLSSLLSSGVDMVSAIAITTDVVQNGFFQDVLRMASKRVEKGEPFSKAFESSKNLYPPLVGEMIAVGEETGQLSTMLGRLADFYETEVMRKSKDMSTIIEPFLMVAIGGAVGFFAMAMIGPIYQLSNDLGYAVLHVFA